MSIYEKKYQIFVSSTYKDLIKAREEVIKVVLSLYQIPIGMEMFSADNEEQWSVIKSTIDNSDYYLLIVGHRYGSLTKEEISYTEKEFNYAKGNNIPIISFIKNRDIATTPNERDDNIKSQESLKSFLDKVLNNSMCDFWNNENELGQKVAIALTKLFFKNPRIGWVKSDKANSLETTTELTKLIQENRELREELIKVKSLNSKELPEIKVSINDTEIINLELKKERFFELNKLDESIIPEKLKQRITIQQINEYNKQVDKHANQIELYKRDYIKYINIKNNHLKLSIEISNDGKSIANDIFIDINFPKQIVLFEKEDLSNIKKPSKPAIIENPVNTALKEENSYLDEDKYSKVYGNLSNIGIPLMGSSIMKIRNSNKDYWIDKESNTLTIKLSKLTHTRVKTIKDEILIAPLEIGEFEYTINTICDEYPTNVESRYKLIIK